MTLLRSRHGDRTTHFRRSSFTRFLETSVNDWPEDQIYALNWTYINQTLIC